MATSFFFKVNALVLVSSPAGRPAPTSRPAAPRSPGPPDPQGNVVQLSALRGQYVLLDFWALLDPSGHVVGQNLRGAALEQRLAQLQG